MKKTTQLFAGLLMLTGVLSACSPAGNEGFIPGAICSGYSTNR